MTERFTVYSDGKWWDRITHEYVTLDNLFRTVEELDNKLESKQHTINEMAKTIRIYDDGYIDLNKKYKKLKDENEQLKQSVNNLKDTIIKITIAYQRKYDRTIVDLVDEIHEEDITDLIKELKE